MLDGEAILQNTNFTSAALKLYRFFFRDTHYETLEIIIIVVLNLIDWWLLFGTNEQIVLFYLYCFCKLRCMWPIMQLHFQLVHRRNLEIWHAVTFTTSSWSIDLHLRGQFITAIKTPCKKSKLRTALYPCSAIKTIFYLYMFRRALFFLPGKS